MTHAANRADVVVIGGGLAGISAAIDLADAGRAVTLCESRPWLGGATCSFIRRGQTIDNGQHAFLRCCTAYRELLVRLGVSRSCAIQDRLDLTVLDGAALGRPARARLRRSALPAPAHLAGSLARYRFLSATERLRVAAVAVALQFTDAGSGAGPASLAGWLDRHRQDERARAKLWDWLCVAALNVAPEHADLALAASAFRTAVLAGRDHADIGVPSVPLSGLHSGPAVALLGRLGVTIRLGVRAAAVHQAPAGGYRVSLGPARTAGSDIGSEREPGRLSEDIRADGVVLAVPPSEAAALVPTALAGEAARWSLLRPSPIVSVHVIYGNRVTELPFAAIVGAPVRWVIDKSAAAGLPAGQYLAAAIPAAADYVDMPAAQVRERILPVLGRVFPAAADASIEDCFVTRERCATIRHEPGTQRLRPASGLPGLAVAGAWTDTGWPDTMEGAVRSGRSAARRLLADLTAGPALTPAPPAAGRAMVTAAAASSAAPR
ncbi:MAG TPA: hydroxysqualene dehydroxylase HpnE [Streptosporangiaceae bacterium]|nr:hydroxysqualene dehydroxylase HpnE [Streptosporangiaceae bacterium]